MGWTGRGPRTHRCSASAALYTERHPGTLDLDIDRLHHLVGGWQDPDHHTHEVLRPVALAMAGAHLDGGRDVVLPQYLGDVGEIDAFERVARGSGAGFVEVVLLEERAEAVARFDRRHDDTAWGRHNRRLVADLGGAQALEAMYDRLLDVVEHRPRAVVLRCPPGEVERTYADLVHAVAAPTP